MLELGLRLALNLWNDALGQYLAEFNTPLVKRINVPDNALGEDRVLIKGNKLAEGLRRELFSQNRVRWPVTFEDSVRDEPIGRAFSLHFAGRLAEGQRLGLSEDIGQEHVVMATERMEWFRECDEVARDQAGTLMDQLIERMLPVCPRLTPVDRTGLACDLVSVDRDMFAVALHRQLLQIRREPLQVLLVRQDGDSLRAEEVVVPGGQQTHQHRQIPLERRRMKMLIHLVEPVQHGAEMVRPDGDHRRKADRRIHRVTAADPIPELEHLGGINAELRYFRRIRRDGNQMLRYGLFITAHSGQ